MVSQWIEKVPFGAIVYGLMFSIVLVPLILTGVANIKNGKSKSAKTIGLIALLTPLAGGGFYTTLDYFDDHNKYVLWWILILLIHLLPLLASSFIFLKSRHRLLRAI